MKMFFYYGRGGGMEWLFPFLTIGFFLVLNFVLSSYRREHGRGSHAGRLRAINWAVLNDPDIQTLIAHHKLTAAIERYCELTGCSFREAQFAIGVVMDNPRLSTQKKKKAHYDTPDAGIRDLVRDGEIERAVEVYRIFAGVDEYTARDAIAEIERELRLGDESASQPGQDDTPEDVRIHDLLHPGQHH
jgi:hypothetical protein